MRIITKQNNTLWNWLDINDNDRLNAEERFAIQIHLLMAIQLLEYLLENKKGSHDEKNS